MRCAGGFVCEHGREKAVCKQCIGHETCPHGTSRVKCKTCSVWRKSLCPHGRQSYFCRDCAAEGIGGKGICEHNKEERRCRDCKGWGLCPHGKVKTRNCVRCVEEAHALFMKKNERRLQRQEPLALAPMNPPSMNTSIRFTYVASCV